MHRRVTSPSVDALYYLPAFLLLNNLRPRQYTQSLRFALRYFHYTFYKGLIFLFYSSLFIRLICFGQYPSFTLRVGCSLLAFIFFKNKVLKQTALPLLQFLFQEPSCMTLFALRYLFWSAFSYYFTAFFTAFRTDIYNVIG